MELQLLNFIKQNKENWKEVLQQPPYSLIVKEDDDYILLKYNQLESDLSNSIVQECRGIILRKSDLKVVCFPFTKFFNYHEPNAANIDWDGARVLDKIDGSLTKLWFDKGHWHWSTNGNIDADKTEFAINDLSQMYCPYKTFGELIRTAVNYKDLDFNNLNKNFTYMFELVSPYTKIVIPYSETKLYHLATRDNITFEELETDIGVEKPKSYDISTIDDCVVAAEKLSSDYEGFVVVDKNYHRIKIKNPKYLMMHRMASNNSLSIKNILEMIKINECSEFLSYFPEYTNAFKIVDQILKKYYFEMAKEYSEFKEQSLFLSRREIAEKINSNAKWKDYLFGAIYKNETDEEKYLFEMKGDRLLNLVREDYKKMMEKKDADTYFIHNVWTASVGEDNQG